VRLIRRTHPPGTAPGTIAVTGDSGTPSRSILIRYSADRIEEAEVADFSWLDQVAPEDKIWIDIEGHDVEQIADLGRHLGVHNLVLEDVVNVGQRPKVQEFDDCLFVVARHLERRSPEDTITEEQVSLILLGRIVVTIRERPGDLWEPVRGRLRRGKGRIRSAGTDYLLYALVDAVVDHHFPVLEDVGDRIEAAEGSLLEESDVNLVPVLHGLRRDLSLIRRSVWPLRDALNRYLHSDNPLIQEETGVFLRDVTDHLVFLAEMVETYRDVLNGLMDLSFSGATARMNDVMKVLTIIATIFIPLSFIAGLYGMNFDREAGPMNMPELGWAWGYPLALVIMLLVAGGLVAFFRKRRWI